MRKIEDVMKRLAKGEALTRAHRAHRLMGLSDGSRECHVESDWLLIWRDDGDSITFTRTGTHSDLFE